MSFVNVAPQLVSTAAADAARIGSAINTANTAAAATTQVLAAAQDEVSTAIAALFGSHGQHYQAISAQVAAYQQRFVLALSQAGSTYAVAEAASATPLQLVNTTEPVVFISLNGGQMVPVLLDTGSTGLVMDSQFLTQNFGPVIGTGTAGYAGGLTYNYNTYSTTVDFGNGLLTLPTSVNVVTSSSPGTLGNFLSRSGAVGVLGIGPNNGFPGTSSIVTAMPGLLNNGVLIDESAGILQFGPNTLTGGITISGAPISTVAVQIDNGPLQQAPVMFDSGGINGTIPSALASLPSGGFVPAGTTISVYTSDGQTLLYSYTTTATNTPFVTSGGVMNTGHVPFAQQPIYVSYSPTAIGTTTFN